MCKWCEGRRGHPTSGSVAPSSCPFCGKDLHKKEAGRIFLEVPGQSSSKGRVLPDINERRDPAMTGRSKECNLSKSLPSSSSSSSSSPRSQDHSPIKLPPISGFTQKPSSSSSSCTPHKTLQMRSVAYLKQEVEAAKKTEDWSAVEDFFADVQSTVASLSRTFKTDGKEMNVEKILQVYDILSESSESVQRVTMKTLISCLLTQQLPQTRELVDALFVVLLNPLFSEVSNYLVFAHIMRRLSLLQNNHLYQVVNWLTRLSERSFKDLLVRIRDFISCRLFPPSENKLPPLHKATWWVPSAVKVVALLRAANDLSTPRLVGYMDFYVSSIDHLNLLNYYNAWQDPNTHSRFSFCQYPFIISINAKRKILQQDSEQQMISVARNVLLAEVQCSGSEPNIDMLFLNLNVRRSHLVSDSLEELSSKRRELKKKLKVSFIGEPGLDMGGLKKEWFLLLTREIFQPHYGMFKMDKESLTYWFCDNPKKGLQEYNLVGKLMGLAVYNSINLDVRFPLVCYKKLLSPAIVPYNDPHAVVGIVKVTLDDVTEAMPGVGRGLKELLEYDGNVDEDFCLSFQITISEGDNIITKDLKENGNKIPVTNVNRKEYVGLYTDFLFNKNIYHQFQAFYLGFHSVCASNALIMLQPEEVELLVCGNPVLDMSSLKGIVVYDGYNNQDKTIEHFWNVILDEFTEEQQKQLLTFATGSDRLPAGGISEMEFKISRYDDKESLPMSHTCFNQLILPNYMDKRILKERLTIAIQNAEGFGLK